MADSRVAIVFFYYLNGMRKKTKKTNKFLGIILRVFMPRALRISLENELFENFSN